MPGKSAIYRNLDASDAAASRVSRRAGDGDRGSDRIIFAPGR